MAALVGKVEGAKEGRNISLRSRYSQSQAGMRCRWREALHLDISRSSSTRTYPSRTWVVALVAVTGMDRCKSARHSQHSPCQTRTRPRCWWVRHLGKSHCAQTRTC